MPGSNIVLHKHSISKGERNLLLGNRSLTIWFTGLSGSGKSTLADLLEQKLMLNGYLAYILDGDNTRMGLNRDLGFDDEDRKENIRRAGEVAKLMVDSGLIVICAFISPFRQDRRDVRCLMGKDEFIEVFVKCSLELCEQRDVKGLYQKARSGELTNFTGIDSAYEEPENPEYIIDTETSSPEESIENLYTYIVKKLSL